MAETDQVAKAEETALGHGDGQDPDVEFRIEPVQAVDIAVHRDDGVAVSPPQPVRDLDETHLLTADLEGREDMK
ncbi:hypothetical protein SAE02_02790 [Skermanella aerolata]|uniref:Uncharacterized protein n=1 Tax=Skermanella aerolata TaxID=393310 RepID=A0A512DI17_9PROT|nr:hypothetical protein SAE02_02790 [Skermanella aerolata]